VNLYASLEPNLRRNLGILFVAGLVFWSSTTAMLPTIPLYVQFLGGNDRQVGFVMGAFAIGLLLSRRQLGGLADRHSRKIVLLVGTFVATIAPLGYLLADSIPFLFGIRIFHGVSIAAFTTAYSALVADLAPPQHRGQLIGHMTLVAPLGFATGPMLGGFVQSEYGHAPLFFLVALLGGISFVLTARSRDSERNTATIVTDNDENANSFFRLLASRKIRIPTLVMLFGGLLFGTISSFIPLYLKSAQIDLNPGWFYTSAAVGSFSMRLFCGRASDRLGRGIFLSVACGLYLVSMLALWRANTPQFFLLAAFIEGLAAGIFIPMSIALVSDRSYPQERGRTFSLCIGGFDLGVAIAGPVLGTIAYEIGYRDLFGIAAAIAAISLVFFCTQNSKDLPHSLRFATGRERDIYAIQPSEW